MNIFTCPFPDELLSNILFVVIVMRAASSEFHVVLHQILQVTTERKVLQESITQPPNLVKIVLNTCTT